MNTELGCELLSSLGIIALIGPSWSKIRLTSRPLGMGCRGFTGLFWWSVAEISLVPGFNINYQKQRKIWSGQLVHFFLFEEILRHCFWTGVILLPGDHLAVSETFFVAHLGGARAAEPGG